jgi:glucose-1-phosphate cytidylyltransferase
MTETSDPSQNDVVKAVILAGGFGTRLAEETDVVPKPMVEIGGKPILWHIMQIYAHHGIEDFVVCLGYRSYVIKEYFAHYFLHTADVTFDLSKNEMEVHRPGDARWRVTLVETGIDTLTAGRLRRVRDYLDEGTFCLTYGDGVADIDVTATIAFHRGRGRLATVTAVRPPGRFGTLEIQDDRVTAFTEKPARDGPFINGGFFVMEPGVIDLIEGDQTILERDTLALLAERGELAAYVHDGFWQPMDTLREKRDLEALWASGRAPWKLW